MIRKIKREKTMRSSSMLLARDSISTLPRLSSGSRVEDLITGPKLQAKLGLPAAQHTVRHGCRKGRLGVQLTPGGTWYIPKPKIDALCQAAAGVASTVAESDRRTAAGEDRR